VPPTRNAAGSHTPAVVEARPSKVYSPAPIIPPTPMAVALVTVMAPLDVFTIAPGRR
jgi:hypothetical protein